MKKIIIKIILIHDLKDENGNEVLFNILIILIFSSSFNFVLSPKRKIIIFELKRKE